VGFLSNIWYMRTIVLPLLDIFVLTLILYKSYQIFLQTRAISLVKGILFLGFLYAGAFLLDLRTVLGILNFLAPSLIVAIAIIFQPELRKIFIRIGQGNIFRFNDRTQPLQIESVMKAAQYLAEHGRGALIVFVRNVGQKNLAETGTRIDGELSTSLLISIFAHDTPLHDGAVIIDQGRIVSAGSFLPLSEQQDIKRSFGTRHRAALGLAEESDAVVLIVSEETKAISLAYDSAIHYDLEYEEVFERLTDLLNLEPTKQLEASHDD
jgi:diadenylate cyclase